MINRTIEPRMSSFLPSAAVLSFSPLHRDARVQRQISALTSMCRVTAISLTDPGIEGVRFVDVRPRPKTMPQKALKAFRLKTGLFEALYRSEDVICKATHTLKSHDFDLIVANDIDTLPVALKNRGAAKVLFDAHEYAPRQFDGSFVWRMLFRNYKEHLCRTRIPQVDAMTTVGSAIADEYARAFGVRPSVVLNTPHYLALDRETRHDGIIKMVHHGDASRARRLEIMIDAMALLDERYRLDFMLIPSDPKYLASLKRRASSDSRIAFPSPVKPDEIVEKISEYDVGLYSLPPNSFNARHALPNKLFDFIQARLCVAIGPSPEMKRLVEQHGCGVVAQDFTAEALAETLRTLDRQKVEAARRAADAAAAELCYEKSAEVLLGIVRDLLGLGADAGPNRSAVAARG